MMTRNLESCPIASIVIPCFNREHWVGRAIDSSLSQTLKDLEVIVVDDGSTDNSILTIRSFGSQVRLIRQENRGPASARNRGLNAATGDFVLFLDSDDYIESNSLENLVNVSQSSDIVFGPFAFERNGEIFNRSHPEITSNAFEFAYKWVCGQFVPTCSVLWRRSFVEAIGGWQNSALRNDDGEIVLRAIILGARFSFANAGFGFYCHHDSPGRVSNRTGRAILHNQLNLLETLFELAINRHFRGFETIIGRAMYSIAIEAFTFDVDDIGEHALMRARSLGFRGHAGCWRHRTSSGLLGLRRKLKLARLIRNMPRAAVSICRSSIAD